MQVQCNYSALGNPYILYLDQTLWLLFISSFNFLWLLFKGGDYSKLVFITLDSLLATKAMYFISVSWLPLASDQGGLIFEMGLYLSCMRWVRCTFIQAEYLITGDTGAFVKAGL